MIENVAPRSQDGVVAMRLILAMLSPLECEIIRSACDGQSDIELVAEVSRHEQLSEAIRRTHADVVILGLSRLGPASEVPLLLIEYPCLKLVTIDSDRVEARLYQLSLQQTTMLDFTPKDLLRVLRSSFSTEPD